MILSRCAETKNPYSHGYLISQMEYGLPEGELPKGNQVLLWAVSGITRILAKWDTGIWWMPCPISVNVPLSCCVKNSFIDQPLCAAVSMAIRRS